jgi:hypothetical protein
MKRPSYPGRIGSYPAKVGQSRYKRDTGFMTFVNLKYKQMKLFGKIVVLKLKR